LIKISLDIISLVEIINAEYFIIIVYYIIGRYNVYLELLAIWLFVYWFILIHLKCLYKKALVNHYDFKKDLKLKF